MTDSSRERAADGLWGQSPDGSPVALWLALPPDDSAQIISAVVEPEGDLLELGCGAGRITRVLSALGYRVTAVDDDPAMLQHVTTAETVAADIFTLRLNRIFDAVVLASYLVNHPDRQRRHNLFETCAAHLRQGGVALLQRQKDGLAEHMSDGTRTVGIVKVAQEVTARHPDGSFEMALTYRLGSRSWVQNIHAIDLPESQLAAEAAEVGLALVGFRDEPRTWAELRKT